MAGVTLLITVKGNPEDLSSQMKENPNELLLENVANNKPPRSQASSGEGPRASLGRGKEG